MSGYSYLTVALSARTLAHIYPAGLEIEVRLDPGVAGAEHRGLDRRAVLRRPVQERQVRSSE